MQRRYQKTLLVLLSLFLGGIPSSSWAQQRAGGIFYTLSTGDPATHLYTVRVKVEPPPSGRPHLDLVLPVWTPGSYLVREFARHVQDFKVVSGGDRWEKTSKNRWRVWLTDGPVEVIYRVYANDLSVRTSHLDDSHGYVNGANVFMYVDGLENQPLRLTIDVPGGWDVAVALPRVAEAPGFTFEAPDYDRLVDSPIETGRFERIEFDVLGKPHTIAVWGKGNYDPRRLAADFGAIVQEGARIFGGLPYDRYLFIVHLYPGGGGGLEHLDSTTVEASPFIFQKKESYRDFLELVAHEHFHAWLVKRIRPATLGPFDYSGENYTRMLWLMEGATDYYAAVLLRRAKLMTEDEYNKGLAKAIRQLDETPGRRHLSLEEASFDAWIKYYRQNEHSVNNQISYYTKGAVVSAMLDAEIQGRTAGKKSLDDVLRYLWERYANKGVGVPEDAVQPAVEAVAGSSFETFFDDCVRGTADIDYNAYLGKIGMRLKTEVKKDDGRLEPEKSGGWLGAKLADEGGKTIVRNVLEDSPAWKGGLNADDQLLALDGVRVTAATLPDRLADLGSGKTITLTIFRRDTLQSLTIALGAMPPDTYTVEKIPPPAKEPSSPKTKP